MEKTDLGPLHCRHCGKFNDLNTDMDNTGAIPEDGDYALCIGCGKWNIFHRGGYRLPTKKEQSEIRKNPDCARAERAWQQVKQ